MQQRPARRRLSTAGLRDQHQRNVGQRQNRGVNEVEVPPKLLEFDRDILVESREERTGVGRRALLTPLPPHEERRRSDISTDRIVQVYRAGITAHGAVGGRHECLRRGLRTVYADALVQHS